MDSKIRITAIAKKFQSGYLFLPATPSDKMVMNQFCYETGTEYVTIEIKKSKADKTYDQLKALFALIPIAWELDHNGARPTELERGKQYDSFIAAFADKETSTIDPALEIPVTASRMSIGQMSRFIQSICNYCMEKMGQAPDSFIVTECAQVFEEFTRYKNSLEVDPTDLDSDGNYLNIDEWVSKHPASMADGDMQAVETCHIISKGSRPEFRYCVWNLMRLTHYQHICIQHAKGWDELFRMFPYLKGRKNRAERLAAEYDKGNKSLVSNVAPSEKIETEEQFRTALGDLAGKSETKSLADEALEIF